MTVIEAIQRIDNIKPNTYMQADKIKWLNEIDGRIKKEIIDTHDGYEEHPFDGYTDNDINTEMLAESPYDDLYLKWLEAQIDYSNNEYTKYNNSMQMFNTKYDDFERFYNRTNMPLGQKIRYW